MEKLYLSKSMYCKGKQCNKILWMDKYKNELAEDTMNENVLENGNKVGNLARKLFGEYHNIEFNKNLKEMIKETIEYIKKAPNIITEASFNYNNNFCSVDILKNDIDGVEIYEVKSSSSIHDIYLDDVSYQYFVLFNLGLNIKSANILYINNQYVRKGELELNKLFNIEDVTEIAISKQEEIKNKIEELKIYINQEEEDKDIGMYCFKPYMCPYFNYCARKLPENNVFNLKSGIKTSTMMKLYKEGLYDFNDLVNEDINKKNKQQIEFELYDKEDFIDKEKIKEFIDTLAYPIYFLDFETYQQPIPEYDGVKPYMQIPFQYSLHYIEYEGAKLEHKEFLAKAGEDPRRKLAERLIKDIPMNVCVTAYNMSFEKTRILELAELFPDLRNHLLNIHDNIKDLMIPFLKRWYYNKDMKGSYSIKFVLPALFPNDPDLDYHKLPVVHNGGEAMNVFATLKEKPEEEQKIIRNGLLEYCKLDTLAMVKIWKKFEEIIKK